MPPVGTIRVNRSLKLTFLIIVFLITGRGLYVRFTTGFGVGLGGTDNVGLGVAFTFGRTALLFFTAALTLPLRASMMIWFSLVYTSTQMASVHLAKEAAGVEKRSAQMRIIERFMSGTISGSADHYFWYNANCG